MFRMRVESEVIFLLFFRCAFKSHPILSFIRARFSARLPKEVKVGFKVGDKVIYPNHGIGIVEAVKQMVFDGTQMEFYQLRLQENNTVVNVPFNKVDEIGIRSPIRTLDCEKLLKLLAANFVAPPSDWKDRFKEFSEKMRTGDIFSVAEILKHLTYLSQLKPLSFREKRMLERARYLVISELSMASSKQQDKVEEAVEMALKKAFIKFDKKNEKAAAAQAVTAAV